ncbi:MAG: hypothetical protein COV48_00510 [Elusimicrobia bacterium CG11_big_fil_rev_8_21_14_0_20_64_6]|nr:MAG: hypothetical protein COV48_00510 [Elusimicrobia bacterium CG11_big_fil_rev_8_21_14_0_20_64_6]
MKKQPRLSPVLVALSLFIASGPLPAAAQVVGRVQLGAGTAAPAMSPIGVSALPTGSFAPLTPGAGLIGSLSAPGAAPTPTLSLIPTAAASPMALTVVTHQAAAIDVSKAIIIRTPGAAATPIAKEVSEYAGATEAVAPAAKSAPVQMGLVGRILAVLRGRPAASISFDGAAEKSAPLFARMGLQEQKPLSLPNGSAADEQPTTPSPDRESVTQVEAYGLPGSRDVGGIFETSRKVLSADPSNTTAVVDAVKAMIDADPARYGVSSSDLRLIHAQKFTGKGEQADTLFVYFRQTKSGLIVNGSALSFTIKTLDGHPTIVAQNGQIFPELDVNTETVLTDDQIMGRIAERTGMPASDVSSQFEFYEQKIIYSRGEWHNVKLYVAEGLPFMVAVDVVSGLVFAWDNRTGLQSFQTPVEPNAGGATGKVSGNTVDRGPILADSVVSEVPLPFLEVKIGGKSYVTDKNGELPADFATETEGLELTATLSGPYVRVENQQGKTLSVKVQVKPGENKVVFNTGTGIEDENTLAQINAFQKVNLSLNFLRERGLSNERMDKTQLPVRTNINDECNAYYTPGRPTLNFFRSSKNCVNSAYDTVAEHENGHYWDDFTGGIVNGGMSEGWGDILSMFRLNNPIIGEHFLKEARGGADYIRHGDNTYQYNEYDEVHDQGQAWGGFAWKLRKALIAKLGAEEGAAMAESLIMPTMFAKTTRIPDAMAQVLVNATANDGTILHEAEIRAAAKAHGIDLPQRSGNIASSFLSRLTGPLSAVRLTGSEQLGASSQGAGLLANDGQSPMVKAKMTFSVGALYRGRVVSQLRRYLDQTELKYELKSYGGWLSTDYLLIIEGPQGEVQQHTDTIQRWFRSLESN